MKHEAVKHDFKTSWVYYVARMIALVVCKVMFRIKARGIENVPASGAAILAVNHTSFLDPPLAAVLLRRPMHFVARRTLWGGSRFTDWFLDSCNSIPIDQDRPDVGSFKTMLRVLHAGEAIILFPEGSRSWDGSLTEGKTGVARLACKTGVKVVPTRIFGAFEAMPRGTNRIKPHPIRVVYGAPVVFEDAPHGADKNAHYQAVADEIMKRIAGLT